MGFVLSGLFCKCSLRLLVDLIQFSDSNTCVQIIFEITGRSNMI
jgi:hypothetical protein